MQASGEPASGLLQGTWGRLLVGGYLDFLYNVLLRGILNTLAMRLLERCLPFSSSP